MKYLEKIVSLKDKIFKYRLIVTIVCRQEDEEIILESLKPLEQKFNLIIENISYDENLEAPITEAKLLPNDTVYLVTILILISFACFVCMLLQL